jgi:LAO/AO transport system kinase
MKASAQEGVGIGEAWTAMNELHGLLEDQGFLRRLREDQSRRWFWAEVQAVLGEAITGDAAAARQAQKVEADVVAGRALPHEAARRLVATVFSRLDGPDAAP